MENLDPSPLALVGLLVVCCLLLPLREAGYQCHLSVKNYRFPDNLPRCQAPSTNRLSHIMWRGIVRLSFSVLHFSFCQISRLVRQDIWEMRQEMPANGRISGASHVYLLQIGESNPRCQH